MFAPSGNASSTYNHFKMHRPINSSQMIIAVHSERPPNRALTQRVHIIAPAILIIQQWKINANMFPYNNKPLIYATNISSCNGLNP